MVVADIPQAIGASTRIADSTTPGGLQFRVGYGDWLGYGKMSVGTSPVGLLGLAPGTVAAVLRSHADANTKVYVSMCAAIAPGGSGLSGVELRGGEVLTLVGKTPAPSNATSLAADSYAQGTSEYILLATKAGTDLRPLVPAGTYLLIRDASHESIGRVVSATYATNVTTITLDRPCVRPSVPTAVFYLSGDTPVQPLSSVRLAVAPSGTATVVANYYGVQR